MANDVNRLIDMLYERIEDAKSPALKPNMSMVDRDELLDLLDELRAQLPVEIKRAQELLSARDKFVEDAKRDVDRMMRQAELDAKTKVSDSEVLYAAKEKARQMVARAEERCRQLYQVTNEYAEDALARTEEAVQMALDEVKLVFEDDALSWIAEEALKRGTGARALRAILEEFMLDIMYEIPKDPNIGSVVVTRPYLEKKGGPLIQMREM
mgnify:FL=1